jgi:uncharacterized protein (DUF1697 family)
MALWFAFLRGNNLGKRQMKMAVLKAGLEAAGYNEVKTVLASGNVRLAAEGDEAEIKARLEKIITEAAGFSVEVVLRSEDEMAAMLAHHPFGRLDPNADVARHVLMFDRPLPPAVSVVDRPGNTEILRIDPREIYIAGYRQPDGRYTEGVEDVLKPLYAHLEKPVLDTMRNWNTMEKMLK